MQLRRLVIRGLKARDLDIRFGDVTVLHGENGRSKSAVLEAIHLLARGRAPGVDATADGILSLSRDRARLSIAAELIQGDGSMLAIRRAWTRASDGKVSRECEVAPGPDEASLKEREAFVERELGAFAEAWDPGLLLRLSAAKLRERLLAALPPAVTDVRDVVPSDAPAWALKYDVSIPAVVWAQRARAGAEAKLREIRAELDRQRSLIGEKDGESDLQADAWREAEDTAPTQEALRTWRGRLGTVKLRDNFNASLAEEERRLEQIRGAIDRDLPGTPEALTEYERARSAHVAAEQARLAADAGVQRAYAAQLAALKALRAVEDAPIVTAKEYAEAEEALRSVTQDANAELRQLESAKGEARTLAALVQAVGAAGLCSACVTKVEDRLISAESRVREQTAVAEQFEALRLELEAARDTSARGLRHAEALGLERRAHADLVAAREALSTAPMPQPPPSRELVDRCEARDRLVSESLGVERRIKHIGQRLAELSAVGNLGVAEIESEIKVLEASLAAIGEANAHRKMHADAVTTIRRGEEAAEIAKTWAGRFAAVEQDLLARAAGWLSEQMGHALSGAVVDVALQNDRGSDDCRITVDNVDAATLSGGERAAFLAAMVAVLAQRTDARWRPVIVDAFESVSKANRLGFLSALLAQVEGGAVSQAIVAGCPDELPAMRGPAVALVDLNDERRHTAQAEATPEKKRNRRRQTIDQLVGRGTDTLPHTGAVVLELSRDAQRGAEDDLAGGPKGAA